MPNWVENTMMIYKLNPDDEKMENLEKYLTSDKISPWRGMFEYMGIRAGDNDDGWKSDKLGSRDIPKEDIFHKILPQVIELAFASAWTPPLGGAAWLSKYLNTIVEIRYNEPNEGQNGFARYEYGKLAIIRGASDDTN